MGSNHEIKLAFIDYFQRSLLAGDLWPGYFVDTRFAHLILQATYLCRQNKSAGGWIHPTFHSASTLRSLLQCVGFDVLQCMDFAEIPSNKVQKMLSSKSGIIPLSSLRVGAIVRKTQQIEPSKTKIQKYQSAAQTKVEELKPLIQEYEAQDLSRLPPVSMAEQLLRNMLRGQVTEFLSSHYSFDAQAKEVLTSILADLDAMEQVRDRSALLNEIIRKLSMLSQQSRQSQ